jgi:hypothetical protein
MFHVGLQDFRRKEREAHSVSVELYDDRTVVELPTGIANNSRCGIMDVSTGWQWAGSGAPRGFGPNNHYVTPRQRMAETNELASAVSEPSHEYCLLTTAASLGSRAQLQIVVCVSRISLICAFLSAHLESMRTRWSIPVYSMKHFNSSHCLRFFISGPCKSTSSRQFQNG